MFKKEKCFKENYVLESKLIQRNIMFKSLHKKRLKVQFLLNMFSKKKYYGLSH